MLRRIPCCKKARHFQALRIQTRACTNNPCRHRAPDLGACFKSVVRACALRVAILPASTRGMIDRQGSGSHFEVQSTWHTRERIIAAPGVACCAAATIAAHVPDSCQTASSRAGCDLAFTAQQRVDALAGCVNRWRLRGEERAAGCARAWHRSASRLKRDRDVGLLDVACSPLNLVPPCRLPQQQFQILLSP